MKAETRKQLETNSLAESMNRLLHGGAKSPSIIWVLLGVAVVVGVLFWWLTSSISARAADAWSRLWIKQNSGLAAIAAGGDDELKNTAAALGAELLAADSQFDVAHQMMTFSDAKAAQPSFENAAQKYVAVGNKAASVPEVQLRALAGAAKCYETIGALDQAVNLYKSAVAAGEAAKLDRHPLVEEARKKLALFTGPKSEGREFYAGWPNRLPKPAMERPDVPPAPKFPDLIDPKASLPAATLPGSFVPPTATTPAASSPNVAPPSPSGSSAASPAPAASAASKPAAPAPSASKPADAKPAK